MRKAFVGSLGLVCLLLIALTLLGGPIVAQNSGMRMEIPVPFLAGNTDFPAGTYVVRVDERFRVLEVDGPVRAKMMLSTKSMKRAPEKAETASLRLQKYGDTFVLRSVWQREATDGWALVRSQKENQLAKAHPVTETRLIAENSN